MSGFDGVFFDIGGVILDLDSVGSGHQAFLEKIAEKEDIDDFDELSSTWYETLSAYFNGRDGTEYRRALVGYQRAINAAVGREIPESEWRPAFAAASSEGLEHTPHAVETIRTLDARGYYLAIISDIDTFEAEQMLEQFGLTECFDHVTTSEAVGRTKPDQKMFETAIEKAPVGPENCCYVGDRIKHDMHGGKRAGFTTVAHGGSAGANANDSVVDHRIEDLSELLDIVESTNE
ncbi:HAD family hydrolase [Halocatena halophila]|uniref:HAD family hydrolase n=1 Tax=Halocatena halophila TaxID=2814576 RepID=UPI002ED0BEC1